VTNHPSRRSRWIFVAGAALVALAVAAVAYNVGFSQGAAGVNGLHRPWGFGFPFFGILLLFLLFRGACWGGPWRRHAYYYDDRDRVRERPPADDSAGR
jgi:hypothetical protein